jgi:hypothetical protein
MEVSMDPILVNTGATSQPDSISTISPPDDHQADHTDVVITISDKILKSSGDQHEAFRYIPRRTVAHLQTVNPYVAALPAWMLKDSATEITNEDLKTHSITQSLLYIGIPSSTIPALYRNPSAWGIGFGIGAAGGGLLSLAATTHHHSEGYLGQWLERTAAMSNIIKGTITGIHGVGITANTLVTMLGPDTELFAIFQGAVAGSTISYEAITLAMYLFNSYMDTVNATPVDDEAAPKADAPDDEASSKVDIPDDSVPPNVGSTNDAPLSVEAKA